MAKTIHQFDYILLGGGKPKPGEIIVAPIVYISLDHLTTLEGGARVISPDLMSESEIDEYIAMLKADLDAVAEKAKAAINRAIKRSLSETRTPDVPT